MFLLVKCITINMLIGMPRLRVEAILVYRVCGMIAQAVIIATMAARNGRTWRERFNGAAIPACHHESAIDNTVVIEAAIAEAAIIQAVVDVKQDRTTSFLTK